MIASEDEARAWIGELAEGSGAKLAKLDRLVDLLGAENLRQNLVSAGSLAFAWQRHLADSAQLLRFVPRETRSWVDLGSGAGFPGLVVGVLRNECAVTLVESRARRIDWLNRVIGALELTNVSVAGKRLEFMEDRPFEAISARAFAPLGQLLRMAARFSTSDTVWVLPKGRSAKQELESLSGWQHRFHVEQSLTDPDAGVIIGRLLNSKGRRA